MEPAGPWETFHRWEWFRREQWLPSYRSQGLSSAIVSGLRKLIACPDGVRVLDSSCGLGLKTIALAGLGFEAAGSDACEFAIERARELAAGESPGVDFFVSTWAELPERTERRFDAVVNDTLCWLLSDDEFGASVAGIRDVLRPGGLLLFTGARQGHPGSGRDLLREKYQSRPKASIEWSHAAAGVECTCISAWELQPDYLEEHRLYLVRDASGVRLESVTIRQPACWDWPALERLFAASGYSDLRTEPLEGEARYVNVAVR